MPTAGEPPATPVPTGARGPLPRAAVRSVVVVGAGLAGAQAVTALRAEGFDGRITLLGAEGVEPYDRPPLSKELLTRPAPAWLRDELGLDLGAADDVRLGTAATGLRLDGARITVMTSEGPVEADAAVLATGAHAARPRDWPGVLTLHTAADAADLRARLTPGSRLVVVGAGWIGAEVAGVAAAAGVDVTVVEAAAAPLLAALGPVVGALTAPWYADAGVRLITGTAVAGIEPGAVHLADGRALGADHVLAAVGARPATAWLAGALTLEADGSVPVDAGFRVDGPARVVAVGDLARRRSPRHGWVPGGHWDGALRGPAIAVRSLLAEVWPDGGMAGLGDPAGPVDPAGAVAPVATQPGDDPAPYVFSTQLGHELGLYGLPGARDDVVLRGDPTGPVTALYLERGTDRLTAVLAIDRPRDIAAARRLFAAAELPHVDRAVAADADRPLRDAVR
ncbi:FAD-dependent oxidoreductase [Actinotalea subterranea]|uniref:FAD-dependent oxidoreductase n=1 Tax=Actinotalea subterranea TaxID=2607497 RepID=UPI0011EF78AA|nr:FAD-dependent oxidoreductase [Actinotalea subterranea]